MPETFDRRHGNDQAIRDIADQLATFIGEDFKQHVETVNERHDQIIESQRVTNNHLATLNGRVGRGEAEQVELRRQLSELSGQMAVVKALNVGIRIGWALSTKAIVRAGATVVLGAAAGYFGRDLFGT